MLINNFSYNLPPELIAQEPMQPRDHSRLFLYDRINNKINHKNFFDLPKILKSNDVLVLNNTKVFPARLIGKKSTGGKIEVFLLKNIKNSRWQVLLGGKRRHSDGVISFNKKFNCQITKDNQDGTWEVKFNLVDKNFWAEVEKVGLVPTPPYIKKKSNFKEYQTVFAKTKGSVAAPTAGFHFTKELLKKLKKQGVQIEYVTLHVGLGTFAPVKSKKIEEHNIHSEWAELDEQTAERLNKAKQAGKRIIAVGTTSVRTLESFSDKAGKLTAQKKWVNIFIYPGYKFKFVDCMITNFHLPESTLLMLVAAFLGQKKKPQDGIKIIQRLYKVAIKEQYRFYSFGDGMLIT